MKNYLGKGLMVMMIIAMVLSVVPERVYATSAENADLVTRAEWLSELVKLFGMTVEDDNYPDNYFSDLDSSSEYYYDILLAVQFGVIDVEAGNPVYPDEPTTREFAAETLNFCLGYQLEEGTEYIFSDAADMENPDDAQIAVNRGWFALIDGAFSPKTVVTSGEVTNMLADAKEVWESTEIDENYESTYELAEDVIEIPEDTEVYLLDDGRIYIVECSRTIAQGDRVAVYLNGIPCVYDVEAVEISGADCILTGTEVDHEEAFESADMQGTLDASAMQIGEAADGLEVDYEETINDSGASAFSARSNSVFLDKYTTLSLTGKVKIGDGQEVSVKFKMKNAVIDYAVSLTGETFVKLRGNTDITCSAAFDGLKAIGYDEVTIVPATIPSIGGLDLILELSAEGKFSCKTSGYMTTGVSYSKANGFRLIKGFEASSFSFTCEASASAGIKARLGITGKLLPIKGYVYTKAGGKAVLEHVTYDSGEPMECTEWGAWIYASSGVSASIKLGSISASYDRNVEFFGKSNSPLRVCHHYEDSKEVASCSRGEEFKYYTKYNSRYWGSGWTGGSGAYGYDADGNPVAVYTYTLDEDNHATITKYSGNATVLVIPETIDGYTVTAIGESAFDSCSLLLSVEIPDSVTKIGTYAFSSCKNLASVTLSKNVTELGGCAFYDCDALTSIEIPKSLEGTTEVYNHDGGWGYRYGVFYNCDGLKDVTFESGTTKIAKGLFARCYGLEKIAIPDTVTTIEYQAFYLCTALKEVTIGKSVTTIEGSIFDTCTSLTSIEIPDSVTKIGTYAFSSCESLENVKLSNGIKEIQEGEFKNCKSLSSIEIPNGVTSIGNSAFYGAGLKSIVIPESVEKVGSKAFAYSQLENVRISNNSISIPEYAFDNCLLLSEVNLGANVTSIGQYAFRNCDTLAGIEIPNSVTSVGTGIFYDCDLLKTVSLGTGITVIPTSAFEHCDTLEKIVLPYRVSEIKNNAFKDSIAFKEITIPRKTETIDSTAFSYPAQMTIYGISGTYAETFAAEKGITFVNQEVNATEASLNYKTLELNKGKTATLILNVTPDNFTDEVAWKTTDESIVTITEAGLVTAKGIGTATIKVIVGDVSTSCKVTVVQPVTSLSLSKSSVTLDALNTYQLTATTSPSTAANKAVEWSIADDTIATVDQTGLVTALKKGTTTVTVKTLDGSNISRTCTVTVNNNAYFIDNIENLESSHEYTNNCSDIWIYTAENVNESIKVIFDERTEVEEDFDFIYIYDTDGNEIGKYTGTELSGAAIEIPGNTVKIKLVTDDAGTGWGFKVLQAAEEYSITYHLDGGTNAEGNPLTYTSDDIHLMLAKPTKEGCEFIGWYTAEEGGEEFTSSTVCNGDLEIYARWEEKVSVLNAPEGVVLTPVNSERIKVNWKAVNKATGYAVYVAEKEDGIYLWKAGTSSGNSVTTTLKGLKLGKEYFVKVKAKYEKDDVKIMSDYSEVVSLHAAPAAPSSISVKAADHTSAAVSWKASADATGYHVYVSEIEDSGFCLMAEMKGNDAVSATLNGLETGKRYYVTVRAVYEKGDVLAESADSKVKNVLIPPAVPEGLSVVSQAGNAANVS